MHKCISPGYPVPREVAGYIPVVGPESYFLALTTTPENWQGFPKKKKHMFTTAAFPTKL